MTLLYFFSLNNNVSQLKITLFFLQKFLEKESRAFFFIGYDYIIEEKTGHCKNMRIHHHLNGGKKEIDRSKKIGFSTFCLFAFWAERLLAFSWNNLLVKLCGSIIILGLCSDWCQKNMDTESGKKSLQRKEKEFSAFLLLGDWASPTWSFSTRKNLLGRKEVEVSEKSSRNKVFGKIPT